MIITCFRINVFETTKTTPVQSSMADIIGGNYAVVKFKRKKRVIPPRAGNSSVEVRDEDIPVDPSLIFQRTAISKSAKSKF